MAFENLLVETRQGIGYVTLNRPRVLNALNRATLRELGVCFEQLAQDEQAGAVILTGAGEKAFAAGADINELATQSPAEGKEFALAGQAVMNRIEQLGKPVIAAVNGHALGGGCELAMACTLRIGLLNEVVPPPQLLPRCEALARQILANGPVAVRLAMEAVHGGLSMNLAEGLFLEATLFGLCCATEDMKEGTRAFLEKRAPRFTGR